MRGVKPPGGRWLRLYAADIGRGPDGRWWVLGDRAQAPSGSGYALENRLVISQAFPTLYRDMNVERLAPFFRELRAGLKSSGERSRAAHQHPHARPAERDLFRTGLSRPLSRLSARRGRRSRRCATGKVFVRTIAGLKRADVIWRHVDAEWCDPLELNSASHIGVPGLLDAIRAGGVAVANMPGSGFVEVARACSPSCPRSRAALLGEDLRHAQHRDLVVRPAGRARARARLARHRSPIAGAFQRHAAGLAGARAAWSAANSSAQRRADSSRRDPRRAASTMSARTSCGCRRRRGWDEDGSTPRPFVLRVYAAATPDGWKVMPGGFARVSDKPDARAVSMGDGVESADVWVLADKPVEATSLLPTPEKVRIVRMLGNLPSRAADNLFWFGRYLEREEATLRLVRCLCARAVDPDAPMQRRDASRSTG